MIPHFFGDSNHPLFGIYHPARARGVHLPAVLLCPPIGHEYLRTHWAMRMLASRLVRQGYPVLRFDYLGMGDSAGTLSDVECLQVWIDNVVTAARDLKDESAKDALAIVGLRFGASIASLAVAQGLQVERTVLWEPTWSGETYLADLRTMHATMLDLWVCPMATENNADREEILGSMYPRSLLGDIQQFDLATAIDWMNSPPTVVEPVGPLRLGPSRLKSYTEPADWTDLRAIEIAWLPSTSPLLVVEALQEQPLPRSASTAVDYPVATPSTLIPNSDLGDSLQRN